MLREFGSPISVMHCADQVRAGGYCFFGLDDPHTDTAVFFELLRDGDYAFVHPVLTYNRRHATTVTTEKPQLGTFGLGRIMIARDLGRYFPDNSKHCYAMDLQLGYHFAFVVGNLGRLRDGALRRELA